MRKPLLILVVILALLGGLTALYLAIDPGGTSPEGAVPIGLGPGRTAEPGGVAPGELPGAARPDGGARNEAGEAVAPPDAESDEEGPVTLRGRAILIDERGRELGEEDGDFTLWLTSWDSGYSLEVEVRRGAWEATFNRCRELSVTSLVLGGRGAATSTARFPLPADLHLELRGEVLREVLLFVRSEENGADLSGVEVVPGDVRWESRYPSREVLSGVPVVSDATSPIALPAPASTFTAGKHGYYVRASGHAWAPVELDHTSGGNREVRLPLAGDLEIEVIGEIPRRGIELRVYPVGEELLWRTVEIEASNRLESLPIGEYRVALELGALLQDRLVFGEGPAEILAGRTTQLTVTPTQLEPPERNVPIAGRVLIPPGWPEIEDSLVLEFTPLDATRSWWDHGVVHIPHYLLRKEAPGILGFEAELPVAGSWQLTVVPVGYRERIEVGSQGVRDLSIQLPPLARVTVEVVSAEDRSPVPVSGLGWKPAQGGEYTLVEALPAPPATPGTASFVAPAGEVMIALGNEAGFRVKHAPATLRPGENRVRVELERQCGFAITFIDGEAVVPFDTDTRYSARDAAGGEVQLDWDGEGTVQFPAPGTYLLSITDFAGFEPVVDFEVTVRGWELTPVDLHLTRLE